MDGTHQHYVLDADGVLTIGRDPSSQVCLGDPQVSWRHARLTSTRGLCFIEDLHSSNGTFIGATRVQRHALQPGDMIKIGPYELDLQETLRTPSPNSSSERTLFASNRDRSAATIDDTVAADVSLKRNASKKQHKTPTRDRTAWRIFARRLVPFTTWLGAYKKADLRHDAIAALTVTAMMVPQGIAYAQLAGLPPVIGLYASILPMVAYALFGTGKQTLVGPVALESVMLAVGLSALAPSGSVSYVMLAVLLAALVGAIQVGMGVLRLGFLVNFLSYPVLAGFTCAAALIIAVSQLKHLIGVSQPQYPEFYRLLIDVVERAPQANVLALAFGVGGIGLLLMLRRWLPLAPGPLLVAVLSTLLVYFFQLDARGLSVIGSVPSGLPHLSLPAWDWAQAQQLTPLALTMALVGFAQTISIGKALGNKYGYDINANQELVALGLANVSSSVSLGYSVSAGLSRSAVNAKAGARTPMAALLAALCVAIATLYLTPWLRHVPNAALAAIIVVSSLGLIDTREIRYLFKVKITEGILLVFTFAATLVLGITPGLLLGIVASILLFISLNTRPNTAILGRLPETNIFRNIDNFEEAQTTPGLVIMRIDASLYFANAVFLKEKARQVCRQYREGLKAIILDASAVNDLDSSADTALHQLADEFKRQGIEFYIAGVKAPVREVMMRSGLYDVLGGDHFFFTIDAAVKRFQERRA